MYKYADILKMADPTGQQPQTQELRLTPADLKKPRAGIPGWMAMGLLGWTAWNAMNNKKGDPYMRDATLEASRKMPRLTYGTSMLRQQGY